MAWTVINSGPYIEMLWEFLRPQKTDDDVYQFRLPIGQGAVPFIHLADFARYIPWIFSNPNESNGLVFGIATAHVSGEELAEAFTAATGNKAEYIDLPTEDFIQSRFGGLPNGVDTKVGLSSVKDENALMQTFGQNFTNWWNLYKASAENKGLIERDYAFLDRILPDRVKSAEEWMRKAHYDGTERAVIKSRERVSSGQK